MSSFAKDIPISPRAKLVGHASLGVTSFEAASTFYKAVISTIGGICVYDNAESGTLGFALSSRPDQEALNIFTTEKAVAAGDGVHLALDAPNRSAVRAFWEAAMANGGTDEGKWGLRGHYGDNYYAAFVRDPDGNKLEVVYQQEDAEADEAVALRQRILVDMVSPHSVNTLHMVVANICAVQDLEYEERRKAVAEELSGLSVDELRKKHNQTKQATG